VDIQIALNEEVETWIRDHAPPHFTRDYRPEDHARDIMRKLLSSMQTLSLQSRLQPWLESCFGDVDVYLADKPKRNLRFVEEALELAQACNMPRADAHALVDYVFDRPSGEVSQEVGGVMLTLAALCLAQGVDMHTCGDFELARVWTKISEIREKNAAKPLFSAGAPSVD